MVALVFYLVLRLSFHPVCARPAGHGATRDYSVSNAHLTLRPLQLSVLTLLPALCPLWGFKLTQQVASPLSLFPLTQKQGTHTQGIVVASMDPDLTISKSGNNRGLELYTAIELDISDRSIQNVSSVMNEDVSCKLLQMRVKQSCPTGSGAVWGLRLVFGLSLQCSLM